MFSADSALTWPEQAWAARNSDTVVEGILKICGILFDPNIKDSDAISEWAGWALCPSYYFLPTQIWKPKAAG